MAIDELVQQPIFGVAITAAAYVCALKLQQRFRWMHPLFAASVVIIIVLLAADIPYKHYQKGGEYITFILGPATVALGVPLYRNAARIRTSVAAIFAGITAGSISALLLSAGLVWSLGGSKELIVTMMPKSVTAPIALEISRQAGGIPELTAVLTVLTGLIGSMFGPMLLKAAGVRDDVAFGTAIGTASHGIGTARIIRDSETAGSISGFAMGAAAIITSVLFIPLYAWFH